MTLTVAVVDHGAALEPEAAARLDKKIRLLADTVRQNLNKIAALIEEAKQGQIHVALGFNSWTAYLADALGGQLNLDTDARRSVVELMSGHGASQRTIAQAVGVSQKTVSRDLQVSRNDSPVPAVDTSEIRAQQSGVTGLDGKSYPRMQNRKPRRTSIVDEAAKLSPDLRRVLTRLQKLREDDRYEKNQELILSNLRPYLERGRDLFSRFDV